VSIFTVLSNEIVSERHQISKKNN